MVALSPLGVDLVAVQREARGECCRNSHVEGTPQHRDPAFPRRPSSPRRMVTEPDPSRARRAAQPDRPDAGNQSERDGRCGGTPGRAGHRPSVESSLSGVRTRGAAEGCARPRPQASPGSRDTRGTSFRSRRPERPPASSRTRGEPRRPSADGGAEGSEEVNSETLPARPWRLACTWR